ncbi:E3 ubiquitin-protein ligase tom1, partial [Coemansia spiralis]
MPADGFVRLVRSMCSAYYDVAQKAVAMEHAIATLPDTAAAAATATAASAKGKGVEGAAAGRQTMDIDESGPASIGAFARTNCLILGEVAIGLTIEAGDFIECMSNSLGLDAKRDGSSSSDASAEEPKVTALLVAELVGFVQRVLELCEGIERTVTGAQIVDQVMVAVMKTLVFARHRIYLKLPVLTAFVDEGGLAHFCRVLESMWAWAAELPLEDTDTAAAAAKPAPPSPEASLRKSLDGTLEIMLSILSFILDGEPVAECPEYLVMCSEHLAQRRWFRPGDFVVQVRLQALPTLQRVWESPLLIHGNGNLVQAFLACLGPLLNPRHESQSMGTGAGLHRHAGGLLGGRHGSQGAGREPGAQTPLPLLSRALGVIGRSSPLSRTTYISDRAAETAREPNPALVDELVRLGFSVADATASLRRHSNNLARAANELLSPAVANRQHQGPDNAAEQGADQAAEPDSPPAVEQGADTQAADEQQGAEQQAGDSEPMSVDSTGEASGTPDAVASGESAADRPGEAGPEPRGVEPFNSEEWRTAKEAEEDARREQLKQQREALRATIAPRVMALVDQFKDKAVAHVRGVLVLVLGKDESGPAVHVLLNALTPLLIAAGAGTVDDERLAAHAHLWAVLLSSERLMGEIRPHAGRIGGHLVRALAAASQREGRAPAWLTALALVVELLLQRDGEPRKAKREDREELQRIARRRLTKLPPSADVPADADASGVPPAPESSAGYSLNQLMDVLSGGQAPGSAFEPLWDTARAPEASASFADADAQASGEADAAQASDAEPVFGPAAVRELQQLATQFFAAPVPVYGHAELNALLRLVVVLTRDVGFASSFLESGGLASVLRTMRAQPTDVAQTIREAAASEKAPQALVTTLLAVPKDRQRAQRQERTLVVHVLRHAIESQPVLRLVMESLIHGWFESPQLTSSDVPTYVRSTLAYALRDAELYTGVTTDRCFLPSYSDTMRTSWMTLAWRSARLMDEDEVDRFEALPLNDDGSPQEAADSEFVAYLEAKKREPPFAPYELDEESEQLACRIVGFVADEILALRPPGTAALMSRTSTTVELQSLATPSKPRTSSSAAPAAGDDEPETVAYRCFLIQCLSELVASFPFALRAVFVARNSAPPLLSPRKPRGKAPAASAAAASDDAATLASTQSILRVRAPLISHLVHDLIVREATTSAQLPRLRGAPEEPRDGTELDRVVAAANHHMVAKRAQLSRSITFWATALLSTMCVRHQEGWTTTAPRGATAPTAAATAASEITLASLAGCYDRALLAARQLVLDHVVRAFRECLSATAAGTGGTDIIYARLTSLAHLAYKLVIARPISHGRAVDTRTQGAAGREDPSTLKRMLLERG